MSQEKETALLAELAGLASWAKSEADYHLSGCHASFFLDPGQILPAARMLLERGYFLESISGVDVEEGLMLAYHFDRFDRSERLALRLLLPQDDKRAPSIAQVFSGADWHERETYDFFGVVFEGHPNLKPLLLPDDLGINPLVKDKGRRSLHGLLPQKLLVDRKL